MKFLGKLKLIYKFFYKNIFNNIFFIKIIRKPINTFVLPNLKSKNKFEKDASIWSTEKFHKTVWFSKIQTYQEKAFFDYIKNNTNSKNSILDICCNQGRFLKALKENGYIKLYGVDIMKSAIENIKRSCIYKDGCIDVKHDLVQNYLTKSHSKSIDYAITYSASIELIHPSFNLFKELQRVVKKGFIFVLSENQHYYPRFYRFLIKRAGFRKVKILDLGKDFILYHFEL